MVIPFDVAQPQLKRRVNIMHDAAYDDSRFLSHGARFARGLIYGLLLAIPLWAVIIGGIWAVHQLFS